MDPATSELAQVITLVSGVVGAVVYLQRATMHALTKLAEIIKPTDKGDELRELRAEVRALEGKVDELTRQVGFLSGRLYSKRPSGGRMPAVKPGETGGK